MNLFTELRTRLQAIERLLAGASSDEVDRSGEALLEIVHDPFEVGGSRGRSTSRDTQPAPLEIASDTKKPGLDEAAASADIHLSIKELDDPTLYEFVSATSAAIKLLEQLLLVASATISSRSSREHGHSGLAQALGYRTPVALIQQVTGVTRGVAMQQIRVGESILEIHDSNVAASSIPEGLSNPASLAPHTPWHAPLATAVRNGSITAAQHDAIRRGLGEPPAEDDIAFREAWSLAAQQLVAHSVDEPVEQLAKQARAIRDLLDPEGANARYLAKYESRSFRMWTDLDGLTHGKFVFDDESAEWIRTIIDTALRPRRGGPRFVTESEQMAAERLQKDSRSNDQLAHDLLIDVLKAGSVAEAETVFGARQAGIKLVQIVSREEYLAELKQLQHGNDSRTGTTTFLQESGTFVPASLGDKHRCNSGAQTVITDQSGDPLNVGREQRLFNPKQRVALAIRDGGCRWTGCDRPASYCEAHHIDSWSAGEGRTDVDRGILLCRFHHMQLHNNGWKITRQAKEAFLLHPPPPPSPPPVEHVNERGRTMSAESLRLEQVGPIELRPPISLRYAWQLATPPARRFVVAA